MILPVFYSDMHATVSVLKLNKLGGEPTSKGRMLSTALSSMPLPRQYVNLLYFLEEKVREVGQTLQERWERSKVIPHTHVPHYAERARGTHIKVARNSPFQAPSPFEVHRFLECPIATAVSRDRKVPVKFVANHSIFLIVTQSNSSLTIKFGLAKV